jgi:hypothetical protein
MISDCIFSALLIYKWSQISDVCVSCFSPDLDAALLTLLPSLQVVLIGQSVLGLKRKVGSDWYFLYIVPNTLGMQSKCQAVII